MTTSITTLVILFITLILIMAICSMIMMRMDKKKESFYETTTPNNTPNTLPTFTGLARKIGGTWRNNGCQLQVFRLTEDEALIQAKCPGIAGYPDVDMNTCATASLDYDPKTKQLKCTVRKSLSDANSKA